MPLPKVLSMPDVKAHELLADESRFCQRAWALNAKGENVMPDHPDAVRWDASGAIAKCYGWSTPGQKTAWKIANGLARARYSKSLSQVCDHLGHKAALAILKDANL